MRDRVLLLTHGAPGRVRLAVERLLRGRESLVGRAVRKGLMEVGEASRWTWKDSRAWDCEQAAPRWEKSRGHIFQSQSPHTWPDLEGSPQEVH